MKQPIYMDRRFRLVDVSRAAFILGSDLLRWPESLWIVDESKGVDKDIYLVTPEVYAWAIRNFQNAKKSGDIARTDLQKTKERLKKLQSAVRSHFTQEEMEGSLWLIESGKSIRLPPAPPKCPGYPDEGNEVDPSITHMPSEMRLEAQARVYFLYKSPPQKQISLATLANRVKVKPKPFANVPDWIFADSYYPHHYMLTPALMVEYVEKRIKQKQRVPPEVMKRHLERKKFLSTLRFREQDPLRKWVPVRAMNHKDIDHLLAVHRKVVDGVLTEDGNAAVKAEMRRRGYRS